MLLPCDLLKQNEHQLQGSGKQQGTTKKGRGLHTWLSVGPQIGFQASLGQGERTLALVILYLLPEPCNVVLLWAISYIP